MNKESPPSIKEKVEKIIDEEAEVNFCIKIQEFVIKLWQVIIFELLKVEYNIS